MMEDVEEPEGSPSSFLYMSLMARRSEVRTTKTRGYIASRETNVFSLNNKAYFCSTLRQFLASSPHFSLRIELPRSNIKIATMLRQM